MQLQTHEIMAIIGKVNMVMQHSITEAAKGHDEAEDISKVISALINMYTADICREIQKAEDEKVGAMLEDMAEVGE